MSELIPERKNEESAYISATYASRTKYIDVVTCNGWYSRSRFSQTYQNIFQSYYKQFSIWLTVQKNVHQKANNIDCDWEIKKFIMFALRFVEPWYAVGLSYFMFDLMHFFLRLNFYPRFCCYSSCVWFFFIFIFNFEVS